MGSVGAVMAGFTAALMFKDASKKGKRKWLWLFLGFALGFYAAGVYLLRDGKKTWGILLIVIESFLLTLYILGQIGYLE